MLQTLLENKTIILCSKSPRRKELLAGLNINFKVQNINVDESFPIDMEVNKVAEFIAIKKADALDGKINKNEIIITSDTVVISNGKILGKPKNKEEAKLMLTTLSGNSHDVMTAVCLVDEKRKKSFSVNTKVYFKHLNDSEINYYIDTYKPYDKAGSYGIQEWIGYVGISKIEGSYFNVMGLPVFELNKHLADFSV